MSRAARRDLVVLPAHELAVVTRGAGRPALLLHGLGASGRYWERLAARVEGLWRLTVPDLLGFGRSPAPADATYDVDDHARALEGLLPDRTVVVGHSTGCVIAAALAARHPGRVTSLVLVACPAYPDEATAIREIGRLGTLARWSVRGSALGRAVCWLMCELRPLLLPIAPLLARDIPREVAADVLHHTWTSYWGTLRHVVVGHRILPDLLAARVPVTFVHGRSDETARIEHVEDLVGRLCEAGVDARLDVHDGDHHLAVRDPSAVEDALTSSV